MNEEFDEMAERVAQHAIHANEEATANAGSETAEDVESENAEDAGSEGTGDDGNFAAQFLRDITGNNGEFEDAHEVLHFLIRQVSALLHGLTHYTNLADVVIGVDTGDVEFRTYCNAENEMVGKLGVKDVKRKLIVSVSVEEDSDDMSASAIVSAIVTPVQEAAVPIDVPAKFEYEVEEVRA